MQQQSECQSDVNFWCFEPTDKLHGNTKLIWMATVHTVAPFKAPVQCLVFSVKIWMATHCSATHCGAFESSSAARFLEVQLFSAAECGDGGTMKDQQEGMSSLVRGTHVPVRPPIGPQATMGSNGHPDPKRCRMAF